MTFSERLKELRLSRNLTQKFVSDSVNMAQMAYQRYEYGTREPAFQNLLALADFFDVPIDYLVGNGIFSNWEEIMERKEQVINSLEETVPMLKELNLSKASEKELMRILPAFIDHIEFDDDNDALIINFYA